MEAHIEYRQQSAGKLGIEVWDAMDGLRIKQQGNPLWQPDKDANQREMIEDWLIEQGCEIHYMLHKYEKACMINESRKGHPWHYDKSQSKAFMISFMEYIKSEEK